MKIKEINAKSILRKHKKIDSWFVSKYGMNLYRGCTHNCVYCDGRAEKYNVDGNFGYEVIVKTNAIDILKKELDPKGKRKPLSKGYIMIGGGVGDSYQPVEEKYQLTKKTLGLIYQYGYPASILTKSTLVGRDIDIIKKINRKSKAIVSFSFSSIDNKISEIFEPGVPSPNKRLDSIKFFKENGIATGIFLMPVIPFITDKPEILNETLASAKQAGVDFIIFSGMTLKNGRQKDYFMKVLRKKYPELIINYDLIYKGNAWGSATQEYNDSIHKTFSKIARKYRIPVRIPPYLFKDIITGNDLVIVILEQLDYLYKLRDMKSSFSYAAYSISKLNTPISNMKNNLKSLKGVGPNTEKIILEILKTGSSKYYEKLLIDGL
ncbi:MAG: radical SAM protein [Thermoplasmatales archaeon]|nr:MAG: radical SAM protein [Thermoplasmatales archaeon]